MSDAACSELDRIVSGIIECVPDDIVCAVLTKLAAERAIGVGMDPDTFVAGCLITFNEVMRRRRS